MFNQGVRELLASLPKLDGLDDTTVYRLLSGAWLEVVERGELDAPSIGTAPTAAELRRLAMALQIHAVLRPSLDQQVSRACAFVAAEALEIAKELDGLDGAIDLEQILIALLYLVAGYDANASVAVRSVDINPERPAPERYALESLLAFLSGGPVPVFDNADDEAALLYERVQSALMKHVGDLIADFTRWLRDPARVEGGEAAELLQMAGKLRLVDDDLPIAAHADVQHLARVAAAALEEAGSRALRNVAGPEGTPETFSQFLAAKCSTQPLMWPAAVEYAKEALPGPSANAIISVPTGAGKSAVADLAIQHAITKGWVLYIAPTNALVGQIRRQLRVDHPGVIVREFLGGAEYTTLVGEALDEISSGEVLVMTPEKCSLALRQSPEAFADLALLVLDEAHTLGEQKGRGVLSELVLAEILVRADQVALLLMSALIENPEALAQWFSEVQGREVIVVNEPWRPTRTLRAVVGIDRAATTDAAQEPAQRLAALPAHRKNVKFDAPLAVLAGLRGPWSTNDPEDYSLLPIGAKISMYVSRREGGEIYINEGSAKVRPTVEALTQLLGERGQKIMAFLPRSRHDCFVAALSLRGFGEVELSDTVESLLALASAELGVSSLLDNALRKGAGVHTSALLVEERRASELSFVEGNTVVLFATGTLAQGLNLPATTVIVGGTRIGYSPDQSAEEELSQQRSQLLNAIGRAGRAKVAMRSLALVVPNEPPLLDEETVAQVVLPRAEFLAQEDASTAVTSSLRPLLSRIEDETIDPDDLWSTDHVTLSYLAPAADGSLSTQILGRSWGAFQLGMLEQVDALADSIGALGRHSLDASDGPAWATEAARKAGVAIPIAARFCSFLVGYIGEDAAPATTQDWLALLVQAIYEIPAEELSLLLLPEAFRSTLLGGLWSEEQFEREAAREAMTQTLNHWISGEPLSVVGGAAHGTEAIENPNRGQTHPLPRTIRLIDSGIGFGLTRAAGLLAAAFDVALENEDIEAADEASRAELERLPVVLRFGASEPAALALIRAGARPRVIAHLLAKQLDPPSPDLTDNALREWARDQLRSLPDQLETIEVDDAERQLIAQFLLAREAS